MVENSKKIAKIKWKKYSERKIQIEVLKSRIVRSLSLNKKRSLLESKFKPHTTEVIFWELNL
jgi:hypothetical protein